MADAAVTPRPPFPTFGWLNKHKDREMKTTENDRVDDLRDEAEMTLQGQAHLICALASALERSGALNRQAFQQVIHEKVSWLAHHNADLRVAVPLLLADQWLTAPPPNPADPYDGSASDYLRPV